MPTSDSAFLEALEELRDEALTLRKIYLQLCEENATYSAMRRATFGQLMALPRERRVQFLKESKEHRDANEFDDRFNEFRLRTVTEFVVSVRDTLARHTPAFPEVAGALGSFEKLAIV